MAISNTFVIVLLSIIPWTLSFPKQDPLDPITLDDYLNGALRHSDFSGGWAQGSDNLIRIVNGERVVDYNVETGEESVVVYIKNITDQLPPNSPYSSIIFSNDGNYALIEHGRVSLWRYSSTAKYHIFDIASGILTSQLTPPGDFETQPSLQLVKWSPTGNGVAFIYDYNVYYKKDANADTPVRQLTFDGSTEENAIYNGISDWVYEEEMFAGPTALWISQTGQNLAFVKFNDTQVEEFQWPVYGGGDNPYPSYRKLRYPKAGSTNPVADVYMISLTDPNSEAIKVTYPETDQKDRDLIGTALWASENELMIVTLNRVQTGARYHICPSSSAQCSQIYIYELTHGWVDMNNPIPSRNGDKFIFVRSQLQDSGDESWNHIVMFGKDKTSKVISKGKLSVGRILGWDEANSQIFLTGSYWNGTVSDPSHSHFYVVSDNGVDTSPRCITCEITNSHGELCKANSVTLSGGFSRFVHRCGGPGVPETTTRLTSDGRTVDKPGPTFVDNSALRGRLEGKAVPFTREYVIPLENGFVARARLEFPVGFEENGKYPLFVTVYAGPGSQNVGQGWWVNTWQSSLVSDKGVIHAYIDGRGTSGASSEHLFSLHRSLGGYEIDDQITAAKWLVDNLSFIDRENTAIWGWSYGGYATGKVLQKDTEGVFKCGISVASVTSWRFYDTIYTERYMGLPTAEDNLAGYESGSLLTREGIENLKNKTYMVVHGNADDNVHYQNSMIYVKALEEADVGFHSLSYPDQDHGINGAGMRRHLYHSLEKFLFNECFIN